MRMKLSCYVIKVKEVKLPEKVTTGQGKGCNVEKDNNNKNTNMRKK